MAEKILGEKLWLDFTNSPIVPSTGGQIKNWKTPGNSRLGVCWDVCTALNNSTFRDSHPRYSCCAPVSDKIWNALGCFFPDWLCNCIIYMKAQEL